MRDRVLQAEHVPDFGQPPGQLPGLGQSPEALVWVKDHLHAGRLRGDRGAPTDDVVIERALELQAGEAQLAITGCQFAHLVGAPLATPGADQHTVAHRPAEQVSDAHAVRFRVRVPDRDLEPVVLAAFGERQVLPAQLAQVAADEQRRDRLDPGPVMVTIQLAEPDRAGLDFQFEHCLRPLVELHRPAQAALDRQLVQRLAEAGRLDRALIRPDDDLVGDDTDDPQAAGHRMPYCANASLLDMPPSIARRTTLSALAFSSARPITSCSSCCGITTTPSMSANTRSPGLTRTPPISVGTR